jgi:hypothetical protein
VFKEAEEKVIKTAIKLGVTPRAEILSLKEVDRYLNSGVKHFNLGIYNSYLKITHLVLKA